MANKTSTTKKKSTSKRAVVNNKQVKSAVLNAPSKPKKALPKQNEAENKKTLVVSDKVANEKTKANAKKTTKPKTEKKNVKVKKESKKNEFEEITLPKSITKTKKTKTVTKSDVKKQVSKRTKKANNVNKKKKSNTHLSVVPVPVVDEEKKIEVTQQLSFKKELDEETTSVDEKLNDTQKVEIINDEDISEAILKNGDKEPESEEKVFKNEDNDNNLGDFLKIKKTIDIPEKKKCNWISVIFSTLLLVMFVSFVFSLCVVKIATWQTNLFISCLIGFLVLVAVSYNRYTSGKVFSLILATGMFCSIYYFQYTYDFIHKLNTKDYEQRTYYVVALDTNLNRSIYNINGKKIGMLKDNNTNIRRVLNTTLDSVTYIYFDDAETLFESFYGQKVRAIIVGENYYKYLLNSENMSNKKIKILHEFKANAHK